MRPPPTTPIGSTKPRSRTRSSARRRRPRPRCGRAADARHRRGRSSLRGGRHSLNCTTWRETAAGGASMSTMVDTACRGALAVRPASTASPPGARATRRRPSRLAPGPAGATATGDERGARADHPADDHRRRQRRQHQQTDEALEAADDQQRPAPTRLAMAPPVARGSRALVGDHQAERPADEERHEDEDGPAVGAGALRVATSTRAAAAAATPTTMAWRRAAAEAGRCGGGGSGSARS